MPWTTPKTNWVDGDYFNLDPDYNRIKGNIEYLIALSKEVYNEYAVPELESAEINGYPTLSFFNNVVTSTNAMLDNCYTPKGAKTTRAYSSNGVAWTAEELNTIERNHQFLYHAFNGQKSSIRRLELTLGGVKIGS